MGLFQLKTPDNDVRTIVIVDEREDGSVVTLECEEADGQGGISAASDPEEEYDYIFAEEDGKKVAARLEAFQLDPLLIDTSGVPERQIVFALDRFLRHAQTAQSPIRMDAALAEEWGWRPNAPRGDAFA